MSELLYEEFVFLFFFKPPAGDSNSQQYIANHCIFHVTRFISGHHRTENALGADKKNGNHLIGITTAPVLASIPVVYSVWGCLNNFFFFLCRLFFTKLASVHLVLLVTLEYMYSNLFWVFIIIFFCEHACCPLHRYDWFLLITGTNGVNKGGNRICLACFLIFRDLHTLM